MRAGKDIRRELDVPVVHGRLPTYGSGDHQARAGCVGSARQPLDIGGWGDPRGDTGICCFLCDMMLTWMHILRYPQRGQREDIDVKCRVSQWVSKWDPG